MPGSESVDAHPDRAPEPANPCPGDRNLNPEGVGLLDLIAEDLRTHDNNPLEPGFVAIAVHRFGNWRMGINRRWLRLPLSAAYKAMFTSVKWVWGIDLEYSVKLGRRVRLWHHGGMVLGAQSIGDDVHIRHNTTMGLLNRDEKAAKPIIEDRVDIGSGACILGDVTVGHDSVVGANSVVVRSFPPHTTVFGVPARPVRVERKKE
jgi:serine O-acetyltransferase